MADAPKRIWAGPDGEYWSTEDIGSGKDTPYTRKDIADELADALEAIFGEDEKWTISPDRHAAARAALAKYRT